MGLNAEWLTRNEVPKLLLTFEPGFLVTKEVIAWSKANIRNLEVEAAGAGIHYVQEEQPVNIANAIARWMARHHETAPFKVQLTRNF